MRKDFEELPSEALMDYYNEDYASAHEKYEWYFENSEKLKPSLRGVRVSFCLGGWVNVAKEYPPAMKRIIEIKKDALNNFNDTQSIEAFRDFSCISRYLETGNEVLKIFYNFNETDKDIAKKLFRHAYEFLVEEEVWNVCAEYMDDFSKKYDLCFHCFDHTSEKEKELEKEFAESMYQHRIELLKKGIVPLFKILSVKSDTALYNQYLEKIKIDIEKRGLNALLAEL